MRAEHDAVFGPSLESTLQAISQDPSQLNSLPLTTACLKETLRLFLPGFTIREAVPGATISYHGVDYPMDGHVIAVLGTYMGRDPTIWGADAADFNPDRWLLPERDHSHAAWQPFEKGPRNCIGQQMALLEAKVISVLISRWFDFAPVFADHGLAIEGYGGRAYQELKLTAKPKDGIPMKARLVRRMR